MRKLCSPWASSVTVPAGNQDDRIALFIDFKFRGLVDGNIIAQGCVVFNGVIPDVRSFSMRLPICMVMVSVR